jgi:LacI family transcriptional regulator
MLKKPKISIIEVANRAGVSKSTVSRVVSDGGGSVSAKTREKVMTAIGELGYTRNTVAAGLRTKKTHMVFVMVADIANPYWSELARAAQDRLEVEGYSIVIGSTDWSEMRESSYYELARSGRFDGLLLNTVTDNIARIKDIGLPAVLLGERARIQDIDTVGTDSGKATRLALEHLWAMDNRRIAIATHERGSERYLSPRRRAYLDFLREKGIEPDPQIMFSVPLSEEGGREFVRELMSREGWRDHVDALLCGNDMLAISALYALKDAGIEVGKDISLVGMDDIPLSAHVSPGLTTVRKPRALIGATAAELLLKRICEPERAVEKHLFPGELVTRNSVVERKSLTI